MGRRRCRPPLGGAPEVRFLAASVTNGSCLPVHSIDPAAAAPLGSAFKLYVLDALGHAVASGKVGWNQPLTITAQLKSLPPGRLQNEPDGTRITVQDTAAEMISLSDNTAADMLIHLVGRPAVEAALTGLPNYFTDEAFAARLRENPGRAWRPAELVDHAARYGTPRFPPGRGFEYCDTGYVVAGILMEQVMGRPLHEVYRELVFGPAGMDSTWLEGYEPARQPEAAHYYTSELDWTTISPTIDWAGGGPVTTAPDLARFVRALWSERIAGSGALGELTRWTPAATFPPGHALRYERYGLGMGTNTVEGVELLGHTGFIGAFAFHAPAYDAVLAGTHNDSQVDRWPLVAALCRELRHAA